MNHRALPLTLLLLTACDGQTAADNETEATGTATYDDAEQTSDGSDNEPATPEPQPNSDPMWLSIDVEGSGDFSVSDPECQLDSLGSTFLGQLEGEAELDGNGVYVATLASTESTFTTPSGCTIPSLSIGSVTEVVVRGELTATQENCESYCAASARSEAEAECGSDASCRGDVQSAHEASCTTECTSSTTHVIVAETSLGVTALAELNGQALSGSSLGTISADLTFDRIEDGQGNEVDEAP